MYLLYILNTIIVTTYNQILNNPTGLGKVHSAMYFLISRAFASSMCSVASVRAFHVGGGLTVLSHSDSISCKQLQHRPSSHLIRWRMLSLIPRRAPMFLQCAASGSSFPSASLRLGLSSPDGWLCYSDLDYVEFQG